MTITPVEHAESLQIGTVDYVSPDQLKVLVDVEAPEGVALAAGIPRGFPRVHSYVLIAVEGGYVVGQIEWLTVERAPFPKRRGYQDFGVVDLPFPLRRMSVNPLGTLVSTSEPQRPWTFMRGTESLPTIGTRVLLPSEAQLRAIVQSGARRRVAIGNSRLAGNAEVWVDPDRIFGRHLAVLGNTGSGKSCSVAGLIRWSIEEARTVAGGPANARFIILDPNGEYARAFKDDAGGIRANVFKLGPSDANHAELKVPLWFWSSSEWASFTNAARRTQRPMLQRALRDVRAGQLGQPLDMDSERKSRLRRYLSSTLIMLLRDMRSGALRTEASKLGFVLKATYIDLRSKVADVGDVGLDRVVDALLEALKSSHYSFDRNGKTIEAFRPFSESVITPVIDAVNASLESLGGVIYDETPDENVPIPFKGAELADHLETLAEQEGVSQYVDFLVARMRVLLADVKIRAVVDDDGETDLVGWLQAYMGTEATDGEAVSIIDLSLVPTEVVHVVTAVLARMVFEALQRYRKIFGVALPTVIVIEEAHTFVRRYRTDSETEDPAQVCCQVFERIAREGRKFGLGLVLSSQRPSELSQTVLSQCNTFLLHRITNDRDQEIVGKLVPDNLRGLLRELPSLPSQNAVLLGWASELPVLVRMKDLPKRQRPQSDDPDFWHVWVGRDDRGDVVKRAPNWIPVASDWQRYEVSQPDDKPGANMSEEEGDRLE